MPARILRTVLVVEDDPSLRQTLVRALSERFSDVASAATVTEARAILARPVPPDLLLLDVELPDGSALDLVKAAAALPVAPVIVAMSGTARPTQSFDLATLGVRAYLPKPLDLDRLEAAIAAAAAVPPDLQPQLRAVVGHRPIHEVEEEVRTTMLREALGRARGSRRQAAQLLAVSRQLVQHMLRRYLS
jgi:DNA-binding NtrC family response regulator